MRTMQHHILYEIIIRRLSYGQNVPWDNDEELMNEIESSVGKIDYGNSIVIDLNSSHKRIQKVADFDDLSTINSDAILISYQELCEAYHERAFSRS